MPGAGFQAAAAAPRPRGVAGRKRRRCRRGRPGRGGWRPAARWWGCLLAAAGSGFGFGPGGAPPAARALDPALSLGQYRVATWGQNQGLLTNSVRAVLQTRDGFLWLGTQEGLVRFDGVRFEIFDDNNVPALAGNARWVNHLAEDAAGRLWLATRGGLVCRSPDGRFTRFTTAAGLASDNLSALHFDRAGALWVGHVNHGLDRFQDGRAGPAPGAGALRAQPVFNLAEDAAGTLWVGSEKTVYRYAPGGERTLQAFPTPEGASLVAVDRQGRVWAGSSTGLTVFRRDRFEPAAGPAAELKTMAVSALDVDGAGRLWIGTPNQGLRRLDPDTGELESLGLAGGLTGNRVRSLAEDREGNRWVGTTYGEGGLNRLSDVPFATFTVAEGLPADAATVVAAAPDDGLPWVGTLAGLARRGADGRFHPVALSPAPGRDPKEPTLVSALLAGPGGDCWVGTGQGQLYRLRAEREVSSRSVVTPAGQISAPLVLAAGPGGDLWVGTDRGLLVGDADGQPRAWYGTAEGLNAARVQALCPDPRGGGVWIGTPRGINRWRDGRLTSWSVPAAAGPTGPAAGAGAAVPGAAAPPPPPNVSDFLLADDGRVWVATVGDGLLCLRDPESPAAGWVACTKKNGLPGNDLYRIVDDGRGGVWMTSSRGVCRVDKGALVDFFAGRRPAVAGVVFGSSDGMKSADCNGGYAPAGSRAPDGRLWFPTVKGVVSADPARLRTNPRPPPVVVERVVADRREIGAVGTGADLAGSAGPGVRDLRFDYAALSLTAPEKVRYRYRLEGYERDWVEAGDRRSAYYTNLAPGRYRFRVVACNNDGVWNLAGATLTLDLRPAFYQTGWFAALCLALTGGALAWAVRWRQRQLRAQLEARFAAVLAERARLAGEIHDTLAQNYLAVGMQLEFARREPDGPRRQRCLDDARELVSFGLVEARATVDVLRGRAVPLGEFEGTLRTLAEKLRPPDGPEVRVELLSAPGSLLSPDRQHQLLRICQESITNAFKHARARLVRVEIGIAPGAGNGDRDRDGNGNGDSAEAGPVRAGAAAPPGFAGPRLRCRITDDGRGFDVTPTEAAARTAGRYGLVGMRERAGQIGATLQVHSRPAGGTQVVVEVPLDGENGRAASASASRPVRRWTRFFRGGTG